MMRRLTSVIGWLRRVNPLLPLNGHLLKSWPSVWRSRIIHVLWWSAVTLVGLYAIGMLIPVGIEDIPTVGTLNMHAILIWQLIAVAMGYWVILTWRTPLPSRRPAALIATLLLYLTCIYMATLIPTGFNRMLVSRMAAAHDGAEIDRDYRTLAQYNFGNCFASDTPQETILKVFSEVPARYGLIDPEFVCGIVTCPSGRPLCVRLRTADGGIASLSHLEERLVLLKAIEDHDLGKSVEVPPHSRLEQLRAIISSRASFLHGERLLVCFLAALMLLLIHVSNEPATPLGIRGSTRLAQLMPRPGTFLTSGLRRLDRFLLRNHPAWWSSKLHKLFIYNIFIFIVIAIIFSFIVMLEKFLSILGENSSLMIGIVFMIFLFVPPLITSYFEFRRISPMTEFDNHVYFVISFFGSFVNVIFLLYAVGVICLFVGAEEIGNALLMVSGIFSIVILTVGIGRYISIVFGNKYLVVYILSCIISDFFSFYFISAIAGPNIYAALVPLLLFAILTMLSMSLQVKIPVYRTVFSIQSSMIFLISILIFSFAYQLIPNNLFLGSTALVLIPPIEILSMLLLVSIICRPVYKASYRIYMSPQAS